MNLEIATQEKKVDLVNPEVPQTTSSPPLAKSPWLESVPAKNRFEEDAGETFSIGKADH